MIIIMGCYCIWQLDAEHHCTSQIRLLIDQISMQQEQIVALEGVNLPLYTWFSSDNVEIVMVFLSLVKPIKMVYIQCIHSDHVAISEGKKRKEQECAQLKALVQDLESTSLSEMNCLFLVLFYLLHHYYYYILRMGRKSFLWFLGRY